MLPGQVKQESELYLCMQFPELKRNLDVVAKQRPSMPKKTETSAQVHSEGKHKW